MKKISVLMMMILLAFACNNTDKPKEEATKAEVNIANLVEITIPVQGMTCEGCENAIKKSINSLEGIAEVSASYLDSTAVVKFDKTLASQVAIEEKIADAGYVVMK
ncbi:cation transporter [Bacteroidota bacterium]